MTTLNIIDANTRKTNCKLSNEVMFVEKMNNWMNSKLTSRIACGDMNLATSSNLHLDINGSVGNVIVDQWVSDLGNANYVITRVGGNQSLTIDLP